MNLFEAEQRGMARRNDHSTSVKAARRVITHKVTLKSQVIAFAKEAGPYGIIDEELHAIDPSKPESSFRKRRTELAQKNILIEKHGATRKNKHGEDCKVFIHRDYAFNPPPICAAPPAPSKALAEREAIVAYLDRRATHLETTAAKAEPPDNPHDLRVRAMTMRSLARHFERGEHLR